MTNIIHFMKSMKIPTEENGKPYWEDINGEENKAHVVGKHETYNT